MEYNLNTQKLVEKIDGFIKEIAQYYDEKSIINRISDVIQINEISGDNFNQNFIYIYKDGNIPYESLQNEQPLLANHYAKYIIEEENDVLMDCLKQIPVEQIAIVKLADIIKDALTKISECDNFKCVLFCPTGLPSELNKIIGPSDEIKIMPSNKLSQKIVFVGNDSIEWTRNLSFALPNVPRDWNTSEGKYFQSAHNAGAESDNKFVVGTVSKCKIRHPEYVHAYNLEMPKD